MAENERNETVQELPKDFKLDAIYLTRRQVEREPKPIAENKTGEWSEWESDPRGFIRLRFVDGYQREEWLREPYLNSLEADRAELGLVRQGWLDDQQEWIAKNIALEADLQLIIPDSYIESLRSNLRNLDADRALLEQMAAALDAAKNHMTYLHQVYKPKTEQPEYCSIVALIDRLRAAYDASRKPAVSA